MKIIKNLQELKTAKDEIKELFRDLLNSEDEYREELLKNPNEAATFFMNYIGGYIYIIESLDEISQIDTGLYNDAEARYFNLSEVSDSFDICEWTEDKQFVEIMMVTSNSGGSIYLVPRALALQHVYLRESLEKSSSDLDY